LPVKAIAAEIASAGGCSGRLTPLGRSPWSAQHPFVLDMTAATAIGYRAETGYAATVGPICGWLLHATEGCDWRGPVPHPRVLFV
jgi:hypothetical protein